MLKINFKGRSTNTKWIFSTALFLLFNPFCPASKWHCWHQLLLPHPRQRRYILHSHSAFRWWSSRCGDHREAGSGLEQWSCIGFHRALAAHHRPEIAKSDNCVLLSRAIFVGNCMDFPIISHAHCTIWYLKIPNRHHNRSQHWPGPPLGLVLAPL